MVTFVFVSLFVANFHVIFVSVLFIFYNIPCHKLLSDKTYKREQQRPKNKKRNITIQTIQNPLDREKSQISASVSSENENENSTKKKEETVCDTQSVVNIPSIKARPVMQWPLSGDKKSQQKLILICLRHGTFIIIFHLFATGKRQ